MRTISASAAAARAAGQQADFVRVLVKDAGGTWRDLTTYAGVNVLKSVQWSEAASEPHRTADVTLTREVFKLSYSPWVGASAINRGFVHTASPVALLQLTREFRIDAAVVPMGREPASGDWLTVFRGRIDNVDPGGGELKFGGRDLAGRLADQQIKRELVYCLAEYSGASPALRPWEPGMVATVGDFVLPASRGASDSGQGKFFQCTTAGTTANSEPTWPGAGTVADGTAVWTYRGATQTLGRPVQQVIQAILDSARSTGEASVPVYTPTSPGWAVREFLQGRDKAFAAVRALAAQIGWDLRFKWDGGTSDFRLTLFEPDRAKTTADLTFTAAQFETPQKFEQDVENIRNAWTIKYSDSADLWPDGSPKRKEITVTDAASIAKYGELWAEIAEGNASNIDTSTEATKMVQAALSDCAEPEADFSVSLTGGFPWVEVHDLYSFDADGRVFDSAQKMAVTKFSQSFSDGRLRTTLELRGKPSMGFGPWLGKIIDLPIYGTVGGVTGNGNMKVPPTSFYPGVITASPVPVSVPGGIEVHIAGATVDKARDPIEYEVHVAPSNTTFTPDSSTLKAVSKGDRVAVMGQGGGQPMVTRIVPRIVRNGRIVRGQPSLGVEATSGRVTADLLDSLAVLGGPLNGGFEDFPRPGSPPAHWSSLTWDEGDGTETDTSTSVGRFVRFGSKSDLESDLFAVGDAPYATLTAWARYDEAGVDLEVIVTWYSDAGVTTVGSPTALAITSAIGALDTWLRWSANVTPPAGANYARVAIGRDDGASALWDVGSIELQTFSRAFLSLLQSGFPAPLRIAGGDNWNTWDGEGDARIGNATYALKFGIATGGGGAGSATIAVEGGVNTLNLGAGTTQAHQQALRIASGVVTATQVLWSAFTFLTSGGAATGFGHYGTGYQDCASFVDSLGVVHLRGLALNSSGVVKTVVTTLPVGSRPAAVKIFNQYASTGPVRVDIDTSGQVFLSVAIAHNGWVSLEGITFDTRA